jgi:UDP-N-acetylglucosamine 2-epimerase (non-hydrolysing)
MKRLVHLIAAARPNFMKIAPLYHALRGEPAIETRIVHTGQHYDLNMSEIFFRDLGLPPPHIHLGVGSGTHGAQTAQVLAAYEQVLLAERPQMVIVVGDVNSTLACALAAAKIWYRPGASEPEHGLARPLIAHLEAGLRSFDRSMPEELNRLLTDQLADLLWTPSPDADENLRREGVAEWRIERVGNIMIDAFELLRPRIFATDTIRRELALSAQGYGVVTLHRPANVDDPARLAQWVAVLGRLAARLPLVFPVHPRTRKQLERHGLLERLSAARGLHLLEPLGYIEFMHLVCHARLVITDSGGLQEETTYLGIPCLTLRPNTERPITISEGTNRLCGLENVETCFEQVLQDELEAAAAGISGPRRVPALWDGRTAERVVASIRRSLAIESAQRAQA